MFDRMHTKTLYEDEEERGQKKNIELNTLLGSHKGRTIDRGNKKEVKI